MKVVRAGSTSGLTLLELMMMAAVLLVVIVKASLVTSTILEVQSREGAAMDMEDRARQVLDRIAYQVMSCDYETLQPILEEPADSPGVIYQYALGLKDGEVVWSDPQEIALKVQDNEVYWKENLGSTEERQVVWTRLAREYLEGEIPNGVDDNGNGLIDERGLSFALNGPEVTIRLTLERLDEEGRSDIVTYTSVVQCRN